MTAIEELNKELQNRPQEKWERFEGTLSEEQADAWANRQPRLRMRLLEAISTLSKKGLPLNEQNIWQKTLDKIMAAGDPMMQTALLHGTPAEQMLSAEQAKSLSDFQKKAGLTLK